MRHGRHYVDELLGDAPLRTVREIPISEIEPPVDEALDLEPLEGSIRRLGVLEPLLVIRRGLEYRVLAGMRRLRAARTVGLSTVPCLVHETPDIDEAKVMELRDAVAGRLVSPLPVQPLPAEAPAATAPIAGVTAEPQGEAIEPGLRQAVLRDLAAAEALRTKIASASRDLLSRPATIERTSTLPASIVGEAVAAIALEARLRGVRLDTIGPVKDGLISIDGPQCRTVLIGLLQAILALADGEGTALEVRTELTSVRPALIVECRLVRDGRDLPIASDEAIARFFDAEWESHPCGAAGASCLAALQRIARAHGGRVQASFAAVTFVVPRPLSDF
jgi:ParB-like chromosome segregation protein Spo0J